MGCPLPYNTYYFVTEKKFTINWSKLVLELEFKNVHRLISKLTNQEVHQFTYSGINLNLTVNLSGVYVIALFDKVTGIMDIAYVGKAKNINKRLYNHPVLGFLSAVLEDEIEINIFSIPFDNFSYMEEVAIRIMNPFLNKEYNTVRFETILIRYDEAGLYKSIN